MRLPFRRALFVALALLCACGMGDLMRFSVGLTREFGPASVNVNGEHLTITLQRAPPRAGSAVGEEAEARRVAEYVRDHYTPWEDLADVTVAFQSHQQYGPVGFTQGRGNFTFTHAELGAPRTQR
jgi:hypothetical protein